MKFHYTFTLQPIVIELLTRPSDIVQAWYKMATGFSYVSSGFDIVYVQKKQVQGSRRVDFVIKVIFPK